MLNCRSNAGFPRSAKIRYTISPNFLYGANEGSYVDTLEEIGSIHRVKKDQYKKADRIVTFLRSSSLFAWYLCNASKTTSLLLKVSNRFAEKPAPSRKLTLHPENKFLSMDLVSSEIITLSASTGILIVCSIRYLRCIIVSVEFKAWLRPLEPLRAASAPL